MIAELARLEDDLGSRLPEALRRYLLAGAPARWEALSAPSSWPYGRAVEVTRVYGLAGGALRRATFRTFAGRIPDVAVPLARTACGNVVAVGYDGFDAGRVWLCDRGRSSMRTAVVRMRRELEAGGLDDPLDDDGVVWYWERLYPDRRTWRLGFADVHELATPFDWDSGPPTDHQRGTSADPG